MKLKGSTGKLSRTIKFNMVMKGLAAAHLSLQLLQPSMTAETFGYVSLGLAVAIAMGNEYLRTKTTGPLHDGNQL